MYFSFFLSWRGLLLRDYPADSAAPTNPHIHRSTGNKPVHCLQYSGETLLSLQRWPQYVKHNMYINERPVSNVMKILKSSCITFSSKKSVVSTETSKAKEWQKEVWVDKDRVWGFIVRNVHSSLIETAWWNLWLDLQYISLQLHYSGATIVYSLKLGRSKSRLY